jgi:Spy/CpxP family protein refolding chaperone
MIGTSRFARAFPVKESDMQPPVLFNAPRSAALGLLVYLAVSANAFANTETTTTASAHTQHENCPLHSMHGMTDGSSPQDMLQQFAEELALTGQQQQDLQIIATDYAERFKDLGELGRRTAEDLLSVEPNDPTYRAKTDEASAIAANSAAEMVILLAEMRGKLYTVLTEAQRESLRQKIEAKRQEFEQKKLERQQQEPESHDRPMNQFIG